MGDFKDVVEGGGESFVSLSGDDPLTVRRHVVVVGVGGGVDGVLWDVGGQLERVATSLSQR